MKISNYNMDLTGKSSNKVLESENVSIKSWIDSSKNTSKITTSEGIILDLSDDGKKLSNSIKSYLETKDTESCKETNDDVYDEEEQKQKLLSDFIFFLTGKRMKFVKLRLKQAKDLSTEIKNDPVVLPMNNKQVGQRAGWGINYQYNKSYFEESKVSFSAKGVVNTSDGRKIDLELNLNMSKSFYSQTNISFKAGDALIDPLVINLKNTPASLSTKKISFDINVDGIKEEISTPSSASGFLVLDKNANGIIDDGNELFGPQSGDGFKELAKYDEDSNGWIDENDSIYNNLQIWQHDDSGNSTLIALGKAGVGAIYLDNAETSFKFSDQENNTQGMLRKTGVFLREDGSAGTIQHIDLSI